MRAYTQIVSELYTATLATRVVSPFAFASALGLRLQPSSDVSAAVRGDEIAWDASLPSARQDALVLREVSRWLLRQHGLNDADECAVKLARKINAYGVRRASLRLVAPGAYLRPPQAVQPDALAQPQHRSRLSARPTQ